MNNATQVYEIKTGKSKLWQKVKATSMQALSQFAKDNDYIKDWRMVGMQSRAETLENKNLFVLC